MQASQLKSPGALSNGIALRQEAAKAISSLQIVAANSPDGKAAAAAALAAFFTDCAAKATALVRA